MRSTLRHSSTVTPIETAAWRAQLRFATPHAAGGPVGPWRRWATRAQMAARMRIVLGRHSSWMQRDLCTPAPPRMTSLQFLRRLPTWLPPCATEEGDNWKVVSALRLSAVVCVRSFVLCSRRKRATATRDLQRAHWKGQVQVRPETVQALLAHLATLAYSVVYKGIVRSRAGYGRKRARRARAT